MTAQSVILPLPSDHARFLVFRLKDLSIAELKGKVVMLQFTASWCVVCRKEMPHIEADIWEKYKDNKNFALYGIDLDEPVEKVKEFAKQIPVTYPLLLDPKGGIFYQFAEKNAASSEFFRLTSEIKPSSASSNSLRSETKISVGILVCISPMDS